MSETTDIGATAIERVASEIRNRERFLITDPRGPRRRRAGSLLAPQRVLTQLGKDSVVFLAEKEFPMPVEYRVLLLEEVFHEAPSTSPRIVIFLDCGNIDRMPVDLLRDGQRGDRRRSPSRQHPLRRRQPGRRRRLVHRRDRLRAGGSSSVSR